MSPEEAAETVRLITERDRATLQRCEDLAASWTNDRGVLPEVAAIRKACAADLIEVLSGPETDSLPDLAQRLRSAESSVNMLIAENKPAVNRDQFGAPRELELRLLGKAGGLRLAISYVEELLR